MATTSNPPSAKKKAPAKKRPVKLTGDKVKSLILRLLAPERELVYNAATNEFRTINAQILHMLKALLQDGLDESRVGSIIEFDASMRVGGPTTTFSVRLPNNLHAQLKKDAAKASRLAKTVYSAGPLSVNSILRYAVLKHKSESQ